MAKVLLDTNIVIHRENSIASNYSVGHLYRWVDKLNLTKVIHPATLVEIGKFRDPERQSALKIKLEAYEVLDSDSRLPAEFVAKLPLSKNANDDVDNALLYEVYEGFVDFFITEDRRLRRKADLIGIGNRVYSIESFIGKLSEAHPRLIEYKMLAVEKVSFRSVNYRDTFFDSLRFDYPEFDEWFKSKSLMDAYVCKDDFGKILGFLYLKVEDTLEDYSDITPRFRPGKRLKIGTFKVESTGFRLGERFIQLIFDNALHYRVDEIYVTASESDATRPELEALVNLLVDWGFRHHGSKHNRESSERVFVKSLHVFDESQSIQQNFPVMQFSGGAKRFLPIYPQFHTDLFPDSILRNEDPQDYETNVGFRYALQKRYITWSSLKGASVGDYLLIYRTGNNEGRKKYESTVTTLGIVTELKSTFTSESDFLNYCSNRTVFTENDLKSFWQSHARNMSVVTFILVKSLRKRPVLGDLWDGGIVQAPYGPRPFDELSDQQFIDVLEMAETSVRFADRSE